MVEGARLEIVYAATYREFESPSLRQEKTRQSFTLWRGFFLLKKGI